MADVQPAQLFLFDRPATGAPPRSEEVRNNFEAVARNFYTEDTAYPEVKRSGMARIFRDPGPPVNVKLQWWDGSDWRTIAQNIEGGIAAPAKQIVDINAALDVWTIDHNLGSQVLALVFDTNWNILSARPVDATGVERRVVNLAHIPSGLLTGLAPGPAQVVSSLAAPFNGRFVGFYANTPEGIAGAPDFTLDLTIDGAPLTGGVITVNAPQAVGAQVQSTPITAGNLFVGHLPGPASSLGLRLAMTTNPGSGSLDVFAVWERTLNPGEYLLEQPTQDRIIVTHPTPTTGHVVLIG